jgi:hypothetical protein
MACANSDEFRQNAPKGSDRGFGVDSGQGTTPLAAEAQGVRRRFESLWLLKYAPGLLRRASRRHADTSFGREEPDWSLPIELSP